MKIGMNWNFEVDIGAGELELEVLDGLIPRGFVGGIFE
jgi:hypothetical protein